MNDSSSSVRSKTALRWRLTGRPNAWVWALLEGETELGHIKLGPNGYGWYIVSTGRWGILIHAGRRFELKDAATRLHRYWTNETWRPQAQVESEVA
jgi:hypothetical protein